MMEFYYTVIRIVKGDVYWNDALVVFHEANDVLATIVGRCDGGKDVFNAV